MDGLLGLLLWTVGIYCDIWEAHWLSELLVERRCWVIYPCLPFPFGWGLSLMALTCQLFCCACGMCLAGSEDSEKILEVFHMELPTTAEVEIRGDWSGCGTKPQSQQWQSRK